ncbi:hypothetical protein EVG20_g6066 [Dentipellis fragilis]|uniref:Uncharacterized protein n=1 Tax=Dentipellis fragilis TaxID=205917 RepID=A0A4Y9YQW4_9AGAM|nr:hypothetical protein EVG20_g6066 [Dentipellis fragilis]
MHIIPSVNVIEHAVVQNGSSLEWPAVLVDLAGALLPRPGEPVKASVLNSSEVVEALSDVRLLATNLQKMVRLEHEFRGVPPNPKTIFLVRIIRAIFYFTMTDCAIWEFAEVVRPMHPLAHKNPLAQWLPKTVEASFLLFHPIFNFPSRQKASVDAYSSPAFTDKQSSIGLHEESVGSSASTPHAGPSPDHVSNVTSHSSPMSMKSHLHDRSMAEEHVKTDKTDGVSKVDDPESLSPESESSASAKGLDPIASQIHMLSDPTRRPMPLLGLLCMADVDNIFDVMASMLHQRRGWGLSSQPVVGLAFDRYQTSVQVIFGWFDDSDVSQSYCVPLPRVAYAAPGCTSQETSGIFDLADPLSAEALATFLLSLRQKIESISTEGDARAEDVFAQVASGAISFWRADGPVPVMDGDTIRCHVADEDEIGPGEGAWWKTVYSWVEDVNAARCDSRQSARIQGSKSRERSDTQEAVTSSKATSKASSKEQPSAKLPEKPTRKSSRGATSQKSKPQSSLPTVDENGAEDHVAPPYALAFPSLSRQFHSLIYQRERTHWNNNIRKPFKAVFSFRVALALSEFEAAHWLNFPCFSRFAKEEATKIQEYVIHPICLWMLDRNATSHSFSPISTLPSFQGDSWLLSTRKHFETYENYTALYLPSAWVRDPPIQSLTSDEATALKTFLTGLEVTQRRQDDTDAGRISKVRPLGDNESDSWLVECLSQCLPSIFLAFAQMERNKESQRYRSVDEIAWRQGWDAISSAVSIHLARVKTGSKVMMMQDMSERVLRLPLIDPSIVYPMNRRARVHSRGQGVVYGENLYKELELAADNLDKVEEAYSNDMTPSRARALADAKTWFEATEQAAQVAPQLYSLWVKRRETLTLSQVEAVEPMTAKCDGLGVVRIEGFFKDFNRGWVKSFALISRSNPPQKNDQGTEVNRAACREIDAPPLADEGNAKRSDSASPTHGMFVNRGPTPSTAYSDVMFSAVFRTAAHIEPAPRLPGSSIHPPFSDVSALVDTLADTLADTHIRASVEGGDKADYAVAEDVEDVDQENQDDESGHGDPNKQAEDEVVLDEQESLEIPILIREYKKTVSSPQETAANQGRLDLVAVIKFLGALGITDFPIFGIISEAAMGVVALLAVAVRTNRAISPLQRVRIIDRNLRGFDLATVEGIISYASFVAKLQKEHAARLTQVFEGKKIRAQVLQDSVTSEGAAYLRWSVYQKVSEMKKQKAIKPRSQAKEAGSAKSKEKQKV